LAEAVETGTHGQLVEKAIIVLAAVEEVLTAADNDSE